MKQVLIREGRVVVEEMPVPAAEPGRVLVRTAWSVLSAGTERAIVKSSADATGMAAALDPSRLRRAFEILREEGPAGIATRLRERAAGSPAAAPGYAAGGRVEAVGRGVDDLPPGTRVACAGAGYASHAEWIAVPRHLVVPVPAAVPLRDAAFTTLGAIALQGVRRAGLQIGECAVVLGLGLIGNLAAQILRAAGARVLGFDLDPERAARARGPGLEAWGLASRDPLEEVPRASAGLGADAVLVCAAAPGPEAVNLAMRLCRRRGRVVIVGDVGLAIERPLMYEKELDLVMSTSYGPGRYDPQYEEKGIDYPAAHVRWTENRNMAAFLELLRERRVAVAPLADRILPLEEAAAAYALLDGEGSRPLGILLRYGPEEAAFSTPLPAPVAAEPAEAAAPVVAAGVPAGLPGASAGVSSAIDTVPETRRAIGVGLIGAGAFVRSVHLPCLKRDRSFALAAVATGSPVSARETARRFGIPAARGDYREVLADPEVDLVVIGTRHDLHAGPAREALAASKHVFVEKPLCLEEAELAPILEEARRRKRLLAVGFNRRYSLLSRRLRETLDRLEGPALAIYRVNAGRLPAGHWALDPATGGGRILGECGHFLDLLLFLLRAPLTEVRAAALPTDGIRVVGSDSFAATLGFADGSRAVLAYTGLGDPGLPKERLELFKQGAAMVLDDFRSLRVHGAPGGSFEPGGQDKGFESQWRAIGAALRGAPSDVITLPEIEAATRATFRLDRAVRGERWTS